MSDLRERFLIIFLNFTEQKGEKEEMKFIEILDQTELKEIRK
jgi:hypothetical protein